MRNKPVKCFSSLTTLDAPLPTLSLPRVPYPYHTNLTPVIVSRGRVMQLLTGLRWSPVLLPSPS